jgi:hypothetical protein
LNTLLASKAKADLAMTNSSKEKIQSLQKSHADITLRWQKEKSAREEQTAMIENLEREVRRLQQQMSKAVKDREAISKRLLEKEQQIISTNREHRLSTKKPPNGGGERSPFSLRSSIRTLRGDNEKQNLAADEVREKIKIMLRANEPLKLDKLDELMVKFKGKENTLLKKMNKRYSRGITPKK